MELISTKVVLRVRKQIMIETELGLTAADGKVEATQQGFSAPPSFNKNCNLLKHLGALFLLSIVWLMLSVFAPYMEGAPPGA